MRNSLTLKGASRAVAAEALRKASAQLALAQSLTRKSEVAFHRASRRIMRNAQAI
jgi:hypothetical protein